MVSQYAALGALQASPDYLHHNIRAIAQVREIVINSLKSLTNLCNIADSNGAFYFLLKVNTDIDSLELVKRLIQEYQIAVIPGTTFGMTQGCYLRVAYGALEKDTAKAGIERLVKGLKELLN